MKHLLRFALLPALAAVSLAAMPARAQQKSLETYAQPALKDVFATVRVLSHNDGELNKIGKGYADAYKLTGQEIWCKEPNKVRFQGHQGILHIKYITNGSRRLMEIDTLHIRKMEDIEQEPNKGDSIADMGVMTPDWIRRVDHRWIRAENRDGKTLQVFDYWYKADPNAIHTIWVDPATKTIVEHIAHHRSKKRPGFKRRLVYSEPHQVNGIWMPSLVTIYNGENRQAAQMRYDNVKVNTGVPDNLFKL